MQIYTDGKIKTKMALTHHNYIGALTDNWPMAKILTDNWQNALNLTDNWNLPWVLLLTDRGPDCPLFS